MYGARTPHSERARELSWQRLLKRALTGEGVVSHFQPIVDLYRGTVIGYEALIRFQGYPVPDPAQWFAAARRHGRAPQLEALALSTALDSRPEIVLAHAWTAFIDSDGKVTNAIDYPLTTDAADPAERFRSLLYTHGGDDFYGVIRTPVLRRIKPFGSFHWADRTIVAELALQGPFYNVPELLYFRRDHPTRATRVGSDIRRRCTTLDPKRANRWRHPAARLLGEYLLAYASAIWRAPISPADRMRCSKELAVWIARHANPKYKERLLESPDPAVKDIGVAALSKRPTTRTHSEDAEPVAAGGHHENEGS